MDGHDKINSVDAASKLNVLKQFNLRPMSMGRCIMGHSGLKVSYQEKGLLMDNFKMSLV